MPCKRSSYAIRTSMSRWPPLPPPDEPCQSFLGGFADVSGIGVEPVQERSGDAVKAVDAIYFPLAADDSPGGVRVVGALAGPPAEMAPSDDLATDPVLLLYLLRSHELGGGAERVVGSHSQQAANDRVAPRLSYQWFLRRWWTISIIALQSTSL